mgnify:CR=1 FL=1
MVGGHGRGHGRAGGGGGACRKDDMFELKSSYIVRAFFNVKLRHSCFKFAWLVYFC